MPPDGSKKQRKPDTAQLARALGGFPARLKAVPIRCLQRRVQQALRVAAVVGRAGRRLQRKHVLAQNVASAKLDRVDSHRARPLFDQALPQIGHVGTAGAAIGRGRRGVGEHQPMPAMHGRDVVEADGRTGGRCDRVDQRTRIGAVGAEIHQPAHPQREEAPVAIERQLPREIRRAPVMVAGHRLRTGAGPFHRPSGLLGRQHQCQEFRVDLVPDAEGAADIDRPDAESLRAETGDVRERGLDIRGALARQA